MAMDPELTRAFEQGVEQDEILAAGGHYAVGTVPGTTWKFLVILGTLITIFGLVLELSLHGWVPPIPGYVPSPLGSTLILAVPVAGVLILLLGIGLAVRVRRDPPIEPIV
jgi:hypothetical protein